MIWKASQEFMQEKIQRIRRRKIHEVSASLKKKEYTERQKK